MSTPAKTPEDTTRLVALPYEAYELFKQELAFLFKTINLEFGPSKCVQHGNKIWLNLYRCKAMCKCGHDCTSHVPLADSGLSVCTAPDCTCFASSANPADVPVPQPAWLRRFIAECGDASEWQFVPIRGGKR